MHEFPAGRGGLERRIAMLCVAAAFSANAPAKELKFEQVFTDKGEPASLHYTAIFTSNGAEHRMEVWRHGQLSIKRRTDDAIETYAFRKAGDAEFRMSILDMKKRIHTRIDRTNLYRVGNFTNWFDLGHGLKHPLGDYRVTIGKTPDGAPMPLEACQWYDLNQNVGSTHVCWSARNHLPMLIQAHDGTVLWRVATVDRRPIAAKVFEIRDEGFIRNDANEDIERD